MSAGLVLKLQERNHLRGHGAFVELREDLLIPWGRLRPCDKKKWNAQAQKVDDAEFTVLLDEEWEKLSATEKENATEKARREIRQRRSRREIALANADAGGANADTDANTALPLEQTTTATAAATPDRKVWARNTKEGANEKANEKAQEANENIFWTMGFRRKTTNLKDSAAFRDKARAVCRCAVSGRLCLASDN